MIAHPCGKEENFISVLISQDGSRRVGERRQPFRLIGHMYCYLIRFMEVFIWQYGGAGRYLQLLRNKSAPFLIGAIIYAIKRQSL